VDDIMEVDHKLPRSRGGADMAHNRQLLHGHCHDDKTARDGSLAVDGGPHDLIRPPGQPYPGDENVGI
jgi:5-methylcytosine-specific restriction endonuclease McrA